MPSPNNKTFTELLNKASFGIEQGQAFVLYRKPMEHQIIGIFQSDARLNSTIDFTESGFVFAPFDFDEDAILIRPDEVLISSFEAEFGNQTSKIKVSEDGKEAHLELVKSGIEEIKKGNLQKVVLSRTITIARAKSHDAIFRDLLKSYPNAFCYLFYHPKVGMWCGATPETLVQIKARKLRTMSLAATLPIDDGNQPNWGSKEIEEQQMVSDYIQKRLGPKMDALKVANAESFKAGKLWHLKSEITGTISAAINLKDVVKALHPTPAVCGIPVESAQTFITQQENYKRTFYTGFLGELNLWTQNELSLYVNLRCMELNANKASIFAGGGITLASEPEREWIETQNKSRTMLNIL
ncbi:chorismate-binding protein [Flagellimonas sp. S3867]|uniref:chorismate-binding protein n=1 Tax=Flagellimonas sp. S3867 TaxID=2768063 RepID=UPI001CC254D8|nr:chorismate-binding protein [Flagellimonas sp. S3867]